VVGEMGTWGWEVPRLLGSSIQVRRRRGLELGRDDGDGGARALAMALSGWAWELTYVTVRRSSSEASGTGDDPCEARSSERSRGTSQSVKRRIMAGAASPSAERVTRCSESFSAESWRMKPGRGDRSGLFACR